MNISANIKHFDIIVIGGGASGIMAAVCASRFFVQKNIKAKIAIIEKHSKLGRKLLATGNGHCNLSNQDASINKTIHYHSEFPLLYETILDKFVPEQTVDFFQSIGILSTTRDNGKIYPFCEQAFSVVNAFEQELASLQVEIFYNSEVSGISRCNIDEQTEKSFKITGIKSEHRISGNNNDNILQEPFCLFSRKVIIATGGKASPALSSDGLGYPLLKQLSHTCTQIFPAIVQLKTNTDFISTLSGMKWNAGISLVKIISNYKGKIDKLEEAKDVIEAKEAKEIEEKEENSSENIFKQSGRTIIKKESGEILFTKYGVSGPPVLQLARHLNGYIEQNPEVEYYAVIDFLERFDIKELIILLKKRIEDFGTRPIRQFLVGIIPFKIAVALAKKIFTHRENLPISTISDRDLAILVSHLKMFPLKITGTTSWDDAQVTAGGIHCDELDPYSLESKLCEGVYITGEVLDVDGDCGGYNLQFAWASGYIAGENAAAAILRNL